MGQYPKRGTNWPQIGIFKFTRWRYLKIVCTDKFEAEKLKIAPFTTEPHFLGPKVVPFFPANLGQNLEFRTLPPVRSNNQRKTWQLSNKMNSRFQSFETMYFWDPEKGQNTKRAQIRPVRNFPVFQVEIPRNHWHIPNLKRNRLKFLHLGLTELLGPKAALAQNPYFRTDIGNSDDTRQQSLPNFQIRPTTGPKVMGIGIFGPKKGAVRCPKSTMARREI